MEKRSPSMSVKTSRNRIAFWHQRSMCHITGEKDNIQSSSALEGCKNQQRSHLCHGNDLTPSVDKIGWQINNPGRVLQNKLWGNVIVLREAERKSQSTEWQNTRAGRGQREHLDRCTLLKLQCTQESQRILLTYRF